MKVFAVLCVLAAVCAYAISGPIHASCSLKWKIPLSCTDAQTKIAQQMTNWAGDNCVGEKCLYKITTNTPGSLKGTHTTPVKHYVDDLTMTFKAGSSSTCSVDGYSTSETWYAVLDYGTNYCNLHNLVVGSGITKMTGFNEDASDSSCTQYTSSNCTKY